MSTTARKLPPPLRLYEGPPATAEPCTPGLSSLLTLGQFYSAFVRPVYLDPRGRSRRTFAQYEESLRYWARFTGDPTLDEMHQGHAAAFVRGLRRLPGAKPGEPLSANTVRKHCAHIQKCLDLAGPPGKGNRSAAELIARPPYLERPALQRTTPEAFTLDEIRAWLDVVDTATLPTLRGVSSPDWWRALILWTYNTGLRIGSTLAMRWDWLDGHTLTVPGASYKGGQGRQLYASPHALAAVERLRPAGRRRVFPWDYSESYLQAQRRKMLRRAGLPPGRRFGFHGLRKALATGLAPLDPTAAQLALGHTSLNTTAGHYFAAEAVVAPAMARLPQP